MRDFRVEVLVDSRNEEKLVELARKSNARSLDIYVGALASECINEFIRNKIAEDTADEPTEYDIHKWLEDDPVDWLSDE